MSCFLGIDLGTSGLKSVLIDEKGKVLASATAWYPLYQPQNGWAEQDADDWIQAAKVSIGAVLRDAELSADAIVCVGLTGQMHGLVLLDDRDRPIRRAILWCDGRSSAECDEMTVRAGGRDKLIEYCANPAIAGFTASKALWVRNSEPQNWERARKMLLPKDYLRLRMTGEYASDASDASGMQLYDVTHRRWSDELLAAFEIDRKMLPDVYESPEVCGRVTASAAAEFGLCAGTPVVAGAGDNAASAVGMGAVREGEAFVSIGSSGVVYAHSRLPALDPLGRAHTFCSAVPGEWHMMGVTQGAGLSLKWFKDTLCGGLVEKAKASGKNVYAMLDELAAASPIGSNRLIFLPYLMGERTPHLDPLARGAFVGLSASHTLGDMARAVMEGVAFSLADCLGVLGEAGVKPKSLVAVGGGGTSALWRKIICDAMNTEVELSPTAAEGAAYGAAVLAAVGGGAFSGVNDACSALTVRKPACSPDVERAARYAEVYNIYRALYPAMQKSLHDLAEI